MKKTVNKPCQNKCLCCGMMYDVERHRQNASKFCTRACNLEYRFRKSDSCPTCEGELPRGKSYCSDKCWRDYWASRESERWQGRKAGFKKRKDAIYKRLGDACVSCGITDQRVLEIDHIDPKKKIRPPDLQYSTQRRVILWETEIDSGNLQILCANCHRIKTHEQSWS